MHLEKRRPSVALLLTFCFALVINRFYIEKKNMREMHGQGMHGHGMCNMTNFPHKLIIIIQTVLLPIKNCSVLPAVDTEVCHV